jgi:hypothetical protein
MSQGRASGRRADEAQRLPPCTTKPAQRRHTALDVPTRVTGPGKTQLREGLAATAPLCTTVHNS